MDSQNMNNQTNYQENNVVYQPQPVNAAPEKTGPGALAIVSLILGIFSIVICCCNYIGIIFGVAGLICAIVAKKKNPSGIATAGMVCSIIGIVLSGLVLILGLIGMKGMDPQSYLESIQNSLG